MGCVMKKVLLFCFALIAFSMPMNFVQANSQSELFGTSDYSQIEMIIEEIYSSNIDEVKDRTAGGTGELFFANILSEQLDLLGLTYLEDKTSYLEEFSISETKSSQNVVGFKDNGSQNYVVIGAHYDAVYKQNSFGFNDNFSGVVGVLNLVQKIISEENDFNIITIFYGAEEAGCLGSKFFLSQLADEIKNNILLSINFDSIGGGDNLYYFHTDYPTAYGIALDNIAQNNIFNITKPGFNRHFSSLFNNDFNYTSVCLCSDNSSYIKYGINSVLFFSGDLDAFNGLGFYEKAGHSRIMHNTDTEQTNLEVFGDLFYENIQNTVDYCFDFLSSDEFNKENFYAGQINTALYSDFTLKIVGIIFIALMLAGFFITINLIYKKK